MNTLSVLNKGKIKIPLYVFDLVLNPPTHMNIDQVKEFVKEMFPDVENEDIDYLVRTNSNIDAVVNKILSGEYKGFRINLKDLVVKPPFGANSMTLDLYYPEIFKNNFIDEHVDVEEMRRKAHATYKRARECSRKELTYKNRLAKEYYTDEIEKLVEEAKKWNRKAALVIIKKSIKTPQLLDLHGLYVEEALMFLSDFTNKINPREFGVVTGREKVEGSLRPSIISFLKKRNYLVSEDGPCVYGRKIMP